MTDVLRLDESVRRHPLALRPGGLTPACVASIRAEYETLGREIGALTATQMAALTRIAAIVQEVRR